MSKAKVSFVIVPLSTLFFILVSALAVQAFPEENKTPAALRPAGEFSATDRDGNGQPDHLTYRIELTVNQPGEYWISGELQTMVAGEWQTLNFTAVSYDWPSGEHTAELNFYGGEFRRNQVAGSCRVMITVQMGSWRLPEPLIQETPVIKDDDWQESDYAVTGGPVDCGSEALSLARKWGRENQKELGALMDKSFAFDRWRLDFAGTEHEPPRRVWVDPQGEISVVDRQR